MIWGPVFPNVEGEGIPSKIKLSCYGIRSVGGAAYVTRIPGYRRAGATPETACSSLVAAGEAYLMAWKPLRDRISQCTLV